MGNLLAYSGITTKVRAMESRLITDDEFREMAALESVTQAVEFLKRRPDYLDVFASLDEASLHRGYIEQRLALSQYEDFAKLYRFASLSQRKFLDLYFMHYEISILKKCLRNVLGRQKLELDLSMFQEFFQRHSKLDLIRLAESKDLPEFVLNLEGSPYYDLLFHVENVENPTLFDYELHLDLLYFKEIWRVKGKYLSRKEQGLLTACFGSKLDLLNIQWIYRSKRYYQLPPDSIYSLLIPSLYHLKKEEVARMAEAATLEEFRIALLSTYYGRMNASQLSDQLNLEDLYEKILNKIHNSTSRRNPYSIAVLNSYLYFKELEIQRIITTIESIRYGIAPAEILSYVVRE